MSLRLYSAFTNSLYEKKKKLNRYDQKTWNPNFANEILLRTQNRSVRLQRARVRKITVSSRRPLGSWSTKTQFIIPLQLLYVLRKRALTFLHKARMVDTKLWLFRVLRFQTIYYLTLRPESFTTIRCFTYVSFYWRGERATHFQHWCLFNVKFHSSRWCSCSVYLGFLHCLFRTQASHNMTQCNCGDVMKKTGRIRIHPQR